MLKTFRKTNASVGLHVMPIIPYLTDGYENPDSICFHTQQVNVHYIFRFYSKFEKEQHTENN